MQRQIWDSAGEPPAPLAYRMRPGDLEELVGQEELLAKGRVLRRAIEADELSSLVLYGPAGCGKTSLAEVIARHTRVHFERTSAVSAGVAQLRQAVEEARERWRLHRQRTVLFVDEIHRFNRGQQDALLPGVEDGSVILVGATTENPYFSLTQALVSRSRIYRLDPLPDAAVAGLLERALADAERGLAALHPRVDPEALEHLVRVAGGDARIALNSLEAAVLGAAPDAAGVRHVDLDTVVQAVQRRALRYDRQGDAHYDHISAFIKSLRGSDPDAALFWMARMLEAGEDPRFIARRMVIHAAEDVGLADPRALLVATAAAQAVEFVGLPEARIPMAEAALYIALAPKSNAVCRAIDAAGKDARERAGPVPAHLRDASYRGGADLGHGRDYRYPHEYPEHWVAQQYLPDDLVGTRYYRPSESGEEPSLAQGKPGAGR